ncbi:MAG: hypothetical protein GDA50_05540 [Alphaproteobacteria bacterium GM202ARS2]|nr:hypothetical protein [Alphaproteobacteria bacterium GM202ARS2]
MNRLQLIYKGKTGTRVSLQPLAHALLTNKPLEKCLLLAGTDDAPLGDLFTIKGTLDKDAVDITIDVGGAHLWHAGADWQRGTLRINGEGGDYLAGGSAGATRGMRGGLIHVMGNGGNHIGDKMNRGIILIEGSVGRACGKRMLGGTIVVAKAYDTHIGHAMRRGSIFLLGTPQKNTTTTPLPQDPRFTDCGAHDLPFLQMMTRAIDTLSPTLGKTLHKTRNWQRYAGDSIVAGKGEIWLPT